MATWELSTLHKKSAVEKQYWYKDGKVIVREEGYRWGTFTVESDERPLTDEELKNEDGYELGCLDNDQCWELSDLNDGSWAEIESGNDKTTDEDIQEFEEAWEEDSFCGAEEAGWSNDDTEYHFFGPLKLVNTETGEEFLGEEDGE